MSLVPTTESDTLSLEGAAKILLEDAGNPSLTRTKVRRLYDIANVLSSMNFIKNIHHPETRKPAFRWLGMKTQRQRQSQSQTNGKAGLFHEESEIRAFGTDLINISFKRSKTVSDVRADHDVKPLHPGPNQSGLKKT